MRKILIPTDFTVESLQLAEYAVLNYPDTKLDITFVAGHKMPSSRWEVTHFNKREQIQKYLTPEFKEAKRSIILQHANTIENLTIELFTGTNSFAFQNFLEQMNAQDAIVPDVETLNCSNKKWFNTTKFIKKNIENVIEVPVEKSEPVQQNKFSFISLFN
ncbi:hypothetical protein SCB49_13545 [unidentified eubacterium SCB49]|nr:hypothetical protein SCB49_13545 [unidentified eubacterium SCB49]